MRIRHPKDFLTGALFVLFGLAAMALSLDMTIGSAARMGPGYFPIVLGGLLTALGLAILLRSILWTTGAHAWPVMQLRSLALVLSSVLLFGLLLRPLGLIGATVVLVLVSSRASHEFRWKEALLNATILVFIVLVVFVYFLEFQLPVWPLRPV